MTDRWHRPCIRCDDTAELGGESDTMLRWWCRSCGLVFSGVKPYQRKAAQDDKPRVLGDPSPGYEALLAELKDAYGFQAAAINRLEQMPTFMDATVWTELYEAHTSIERAFQLVSDLKAAQS